MVQEPPSTIRPLQKWSNGYSCATFKLTVPHLSELEQRVKCKAAVQMAAAVGLRGQYAVFTGSLQVKQGGEKQTERLWWSWEGVLSHKIPLKQEQRFPKLMSANAAAAAASKSCRYSRNQTLLCLTSQQVKLLICFPATSWYLTMVNLQDSLSLIASSWTVKKTHWTAEPINNAVCHNVWGGQHISLLK